MKRGAKSYKEYAEKALPVYEKYQTWSVSEANTIMAQAQQAKFWKQAEKDIDQFPKLRYSTVGQACSICAPLEGIVDYVGSDFWKKYFPTNHYGCFCIAIQEPASTRITSRNKVQRIVAEVDGKMNDYFKTNVGQTNEIFGKEHPYFTEVPKKDQAFARRNFDLPIK